jgi:hypothetical protein
MKRRIRYPIGCQVRDRETHESGIVVHVFRYPMLADIRVVRFGSSADGIAVPISSIRKYGTAPISRRRGGGKEYPALGRGDAKTMTGYARRMEHEWDWPPPRRQRFERTSDYQPTGWSSPGVRKAIRIYWRVTITLIKMLISIPLAIVGIAAFWMLWVIVTVTRFN